MSVSADTLQLLIESGLSGDRLVAVVRSIEADAKPKDRTAAERQQRRRDKLKAERDASRVTSRRDGFPYEDTSTPSGTDYPDEASASSPSAPRQPISAARDCWNENAAPAGWRTITSLSAARQKAVAARLREHGLEGWKAAIARARASPYLGGADPPTWFTFDWLTKAGNFLKLAEGNYDKSRSDQRQPASGWGTARNQVRLLSQ